VCSYGGDAASVDNSGRAVQITEHVRKACSFLFSIFIHY
jgi:hypothetical protein